MCLNYNNHLTFKKYLRFDSICTSLSTNLKTIWFYSTIQNCLMFCFVDLNGDNLTFILFFQQILNQKPK